MNVVRTWRTLAYLLFVLCLPVLLLSASIALAANSAWLYKYGFEKYNVSQTTGLAQAELDKAAKGLISYFNSGDEYINLTVVKDSKPFKLFNEREIVHLKDVKGLFRLDYLVILATLAYIVIYSGVVLYLRRWRHLAQGVVTGSVLTLVLMLILGLGALFNFEQLFWQFHLLSFSNEFWQLDPTKDYLIMLFPQGFWYDVTLFCGLATAVGTLVLGGVGGWFLLISRARTSSGTY